MRILNMRLGFATNSSSSHSVLVLPGHRLRSEASPEGYGWDEFVLTETSDKEHYLASQVAQALGYNAWSDADEDNENIVAAVTDLLGVPLTSDPQYVDHQSTWTFPNSWDSPALDRDFLRDFLAFVDREDVVVLGGNDNQEPHHHLLHGKTHVFSNGEYVPAVWEHSLPTDTGQIVDLVCRKDNGCWTLFRRTNGTKFRIQFNNDPLPTRALAPELVDIKITDCCPFGCSFCYQDSTTAGRHASLEDITVIAERLAVAHVFEVAIGGGEPTLHPHFLDILEIFRSRGVVPNFTTRNLGWLRNPETVTRIKATAGSFAYSVQSVADVRKLGVALRAAKWNDEESDGPKPVIHVVMGTVVRRTFEAILKEANKQELGVTLLGWKRTGRATEEARHPYLDWWWESVKAHGSWRLGIDTALAAEAEAKGDLAELPSYSYHTEDGKYSCYIDAVAGVIAASSWEPQRGSFPFAEDWLAVFAALS